MDERDFYKEYEYEFGDRDKFPELIRMYQTLFYKHCQKKKLVDLGCGDGGLLLHLTDANLELYGIDIAEKKTAQLKKYVTDNSLKMNIQQGDLGNLPYPDGYFDILTCHDVLEHVNNIDSILGEIYRIAKDGAKFLFTIPHGYSLHIFKMLLTSQEREVWQSFRKGFYDDRKYRGEILFHRYYRPRKICNLLVLKGFVIDEVKGHTYISLISNSFFKKIYGVVNKINDFGYVNFGSVLIIHGTVIKQ